jgi:hypothetical protein
LLACAGAPKANRRAATMPARARNAATMVATIQPVDLVVEVVGVVVGVDMMMIFFSFAVRTFRPAGHNFPAAAASTGSGEWRAHRLNMRSTDRGTP